MQLIIIIIGIIKRISGVPIYRWALYDNTNNTHMHARVHTHTHTHTQTRQAGGLGMAVIKTV